jgi:DnaJ like chaperone protein
VSIAKRFARVIRTLLAPLTRPAVRAMPYAQFTFAALGRIAKASGNVRPAHIHHAQRLMFDLGFGADDRRRAIVWFEAGKKPEFDFAPLALDCRNTVGDRDVLNEMALESLCVIAWAEGPPNADCRRELERLARLLGIDTQELTAAETRVADYQRRQLPIGLRRAYQLLGVDHWVDDDQLKLAYRRLMSRHHPDKLGAAADARDAQHARENSVAIRDAYDLIRASRNAV